MSVLPLQMRLLRDVIASTSAQVVAARAQERSLLGMRMPDTLIRRGESSSAWQYFAADPPATSFSPLGSGVRAAKRGSCKSPVATQSVWLDRPVKRVAPVRAGCTTCAEPAGPDAPGDVDVSLPDDLPRTEETPGRVLDLFDPPRVVPRGGSTLHSGGATRFFEVPPPGDWGSSCRVLNTCDPPLVQDRDPSDYEAPCRNETHGENVNIKDSCVEWQGLLQAAWCMLRENTDLVRWICCMLRGDETCDAILSLLSRDSPFLVDIKCQDTDAGFCSDAKAYSSCNFAYTGGYIAICTAQESQAARVALWRCGTAAERLCAAINVAGTLFHERHHVACIGHPWFIFGDPDCDRIYLGQSTLTWALLQRYPTAMLCKSCDEAYGSSTSSHASGVRDSLFMSTEVLYTDFYECPYSTQQGGGGGQDIPPVTGGGGGGRVTPPYELWQKGLGLHDPDSPTILLDGVQIS